MANKVRFHCGTNPVLEKGEITVTYPSWLGNTPGIPVLRAIGKAAIKLTCINVDDLGLLAVGCECATRMSYSLFYGMHY